MHALMGKSSNKAPTPQDLYRARKQKERDERNAFLPPGFVNHGNTCFMNSVLQGLIATPMLVDIVRFSLPESYAPVSSRRSPQLTNGHGLGGEFEQGKEQGMPLGDTFVHLMQKAWRMQEERQRQSMSPKELLQRIGAKFDQYLDFRQQDAHEFLRHLLDAMRMEELDVIKKRQPPPPKPKRRHKTKPGNVPSSDPENIREEERLTSFVDMVFGGRLASILVCENCKNISWTYEDFNDLSLSIKQEDYERAKRRDKLKTLAKKLGMRGRGVTRDLDIPQGPRSSSVPSSPLRRSEEAERSFELVLNDIGPRRRSLEAGGEAAAPIKEERSSEVDGDASEQNTKPHTLGVSEEREEPARGEENEDAKREKDEDGWIKMRRKISTSVGMGTSMKKDNRRKKREVVSKGKEATSGVQGNEDSQVDNATTTGDDDMVLDSYVDVKAPSPVLAASSTAVSPLLGATIALQKFAFARRPSSARTEPNTNANSPALSAVPSPPRTPDIPPVSLPPQEARSSRPSSPLPAPPPVQEIPTRTKSPLPFRSKPKIKRKRSKSLYLRRLLADVPSGSSSDVPEIRNAGGGSWPKLGLSLGFGQGGAHSVERCLRLFTGVEVLDGENMVGCRKCWKIQHGEHVSREESVDTNEDEEEGDGEDIDADDSEPASDSGASVRVNVQPLSSSQELSERVSVRSAPPSNIQEMEIDSSPPGVTYTPSSPALAVPVPLISMTAAELSISEQTPTTHGPLHDTRILPKLSEAHGSISSPSRDSLQLPRNTETSRHVRQPAERSSRIILTSDTSSVSSGNNSADEDEEGVETEGETSLTASIRSDSSSVVSSAPQESPGVPNSSVTLIHSSSEKASDRRQPVSGSAINGIRNVPGQRGVKSEKSSNTIPRSKQVIPRRAYKRYLIATPPPVLVVHLKRFQQVGRVPTSTTMHQFQFFSNFKKLDDPVSFPEYLDLEPFLLPKKDDVVGRAGKKGRKKKYKGEEEKGEKVEGCMYRLYAVVMHIGNMLGGHYVAYTALPEPAPPSSSSSSDSSSPSTKETPAVSASSASLPQPQTPTDSEKEIPPRPEAPRTASFARTAVPNLQHHSLSGSISKTASRPSSSSGRGGGSTLQRQWCYISDTVVRLASLEEVLQAKAYICMYERI